MKNWFLLQLFDVNRIMWLFVHNEDHHIMGGFRLNLDRVIRIIHNTTGT